MIRKLLAAAALALVAAPLATLHLLGGTNVGASVAVLSEDGGLVFILEVRGLARLEPLLAAAVL